MVFWHGEGGWKSFQQLLQVLLFDQICIVSVFVCVWNESPERCSFLPLRPAITEESVSHQPPTFPHSWKSSPDHMIPNRWSCISSTRWLSPLWMPNLIGWDIFVSLGHPAFSFYFYRWGIISWCVFSSVCDNRCWKRFGRSWANQGGAVVVAVPPLRLVFRCSDSGSS